jgi:hypothetical protein
MFRFADADFETAKNQLNHKRATTVFCACFSLSPQQPAAKSTKQSRKQHGKILHKS